MKAFPLQQRTFRGRPASGLRRLAAAWPLLVLWIGVPAAAQDARSAANPLETEAIAFIDRHCSNCHNDVDREGGLDLTALKFQPEDPANFLTWVKVHDRVQTGEMPPPEKKRPDSADRSRFIEGVASSLLAVEGELVAREGRATRRRLNKSEYENSLRDLLHAPWLQIKEQLPEDGEAHRFNKVGEALDTSFVHMVRYMDAADYALRQIVAGRFVRPETTTRRYYARDTFLFATEGGFGSPDRQKFPVIGSTPQPAVRASKAPLTDPATREIEAMGWTSSSYVSGFDSIWESFRAPIAGRYRLRFNGYSVWVGPFGYQRIRYRTREPSIQPPEWYRPNYDDVSSGRRYEPITVYARGTLNRRLGDFDITPDPSVSTVDHVWLAANDRIVTDASRLFRSRPTGHRPHGYTNPLAQRDGVPAVAFRWMEVEGPLYDESSSDGYRLLFGDLPVRRVEPGVAGVTIDIVPAVAPPAGREKNPDMTSAVVEVVSSQPMEDAQRLLVGFMQRAYRRPVAAQDAEVRRFLGLIQQRLDAGLGFAGAMLAGYTAVLASPQYVYLDEIPGRLDDHALATRLALFLWNSVPDEALRARVARGELHRPDVLRAEVDRMLGDLKSERFVEAFLDYWLDLRRIEETTPSTTLYNDYYLDDSLAEAALAESRLFFRELLDRDLPARNIVDSDFSYLNDRLAAHYGMAGVEGIRMRRVALPAGSVRGGMMTQASVLKVTANGTTTSPVLRGKWIMERIVGFEIPPPPAAVPAVEPDIRGATTIREQLDKHRADESCAVCHRKIDPPGFALESFDVMGGWREQYRATATRVEPVKGVGKNGWPYSFYFAMPVDPSGTTADGRSFAGVREFKQLLLEDETQIARNLARQLFVYATGAPVRFSDRATVEAAVQSTAARGYGVRSLVHAVVESDLFLSK